MKTLNLVVFFLIFLVSSCKSINLNKGKPKTFDNLPNDLTYIISGRVVGKGYNSSQSSRNFISCTPSISKIFQSFFTKYKVAFGTIGNISTCGACTALRLKCEAGQSISIDTSVYHTGSTPAGSFTEPNDFESHSQPPSSLPNRNLTCPLEGFIELSESYSNVSYLKVTATSELNSDTEYLECQ